jgi:hypothetical protein
MKGTTIITCPYCWGAFSFLGTTFDVTTTYIWRFYAFKMNALLKSCNFFAWNFSLCILLLESKIRDHDNKIGDTKTQQWVYN